MLLGGVMAFAMLPLHMRNRLRPEFLERSGALLFIWTLYLLGANGALSVILAVLTLRNRRLVNHARAWAEWFRGFTARPFQLRTR